LATLATLAENHNPESSRQAPAAPVPRQVATSVIDFLTTALLDNPHRVGKPLRDDLDGMWSARRGTYRVLYRIHQERREVVVLRIDHRRDASRPLS